MIIANQAQITDAVLAAIARAPDARAREISAAAVRHLHAFIRETKLSEAEFHQACAFIARLGQATTDSHNEVVLAAGMLGVSALVCLLNNPAEDADGNATTTANLMGPFWRGGAPVMPHGASIVRSPTPGPAVFVTARVHDRVGRQVEGARVDVWHSSGEGFYENQDPAQADMNLRGAFFTDASGRIAFRTVKPSGYPVPVDGPVGAMLRAQGRHNMRPAHIHFLIQKAGYKTQFSQLYSHDDPYLEDDSAFAVTRALVGRYALHRNEPAPAADVTGDWYSLEHCFVIDAGEARLPKPPISGKAAGARPSLEVLRVR
jgi:catechol 1,2-dioxygenase